MSVRALRHAGRSARPGVVAPAPDRVRRPTPRQSGSPGLIVHYLLRVALLDLACTGGKQSGPDERASDCALANTCGLSNRQADAQTLSDARNGHAHTGSGVLGESEASSG